MKKTNRQRAWSRLSLAAPLAISLIGACGGTTQGTPNVGSESHFLGYCSGSCADGLECIAEVCTRPCLTATSSCADLALGAACTNQSGEPGRVAVCDLACSVADDCEALGAGYTCNGGFCRGPAPGVGNGGAGGRGGSSDECHGLGRYETGKEGGYLPCCPGLNEIFTESLLEDASGARVCEQLQLRTYACIQGSCGDGICEAPEQSCGCAQDCADVPGPAQETQCSQYRDQIPPPIVVPTVSIVNADTRTLYISFEGDCGNNSLYSLVDAAGQPLDLVGCAARCEDVMADSRTPAGGCTCELPPPLPIAPGETLVRPSLLAYASHLLPQACSAGLGPEGAGCVSHIIPPAGSVAIVKAYADPTCAFPPDCPVITARSTGNYFFEDVTVVLEAPDN